MDRFHYRNIEVKAVQVKKEKAAIIASLTDSTYSIRMVAYRPRALLPSFEVDIIKALPCGKVINERRAYTGDWIVRTPQTGDLKVMTNKDFRACYVEEDKVWGLNGD